ncbi:MAG: hypothetical protein ACRD0P_36795, partial [Stackebrandtia sp.]
TLGETVLATPDLTGDKRVRDAWRNSVIVANALLALFVVAGGFTVAAKDSLQARHGLKEVLPRIGVAAVAVNVSLIVIGKAIWFANALTAAIAGRGVNGRAAEKALNQTLDQATGGGNFLLSLLVLSVVAMALIVVVVWVLRICLMIVLVVLAPLALLCHALPQTEQLAFTWWRALAACLAIQLGQAVILIATLRVLLTPSGPTLLGVPRTSRGLLGVVIVLAMLWLLFKVPGWMRHFVLGHLGGGRGLIRQIIGLYFTAKALGSILGGGSKAGTHRVSAASAKTPRKPLKTPRIPVQTPTARPGTSGRGSTWPRFSHPERRDRSPRDPIGSTRTKFSDPPREDTPGGLSAARTGTATPRFS